MYDLTSVITESSGSFTILSELISGACREKSFTKKHRAAVQALCKKYHVRRLEVFGSAVREDFDLEQSDLDLLVEIYPQSCNSYFDDYFGLREELETLLDRPIDLLSIESLENPYFIQRIADDRETLYAA